jgi:hypothetical protein
MTHLLEPKTIKRFRANERAYVLEQAQEYAESLGWTHLNDFKLVGSRQLHWAINFTRTFTPNDGWDKKSEVWHLDLYRCTNDNCGFTIISNGGYTSCDSCGYDYQWEG